MNNITNIKNLVGKTIASAQYMKEKEHDDRGYLLLTFTDESRALVVAGYGSYTGDSLDEYPTCIFLGGDAKLERLVVNE